MSRITYADKVALNSNAGIPAKNKVNDVDMNNVKKAINQLGAYLSATVQTGQPGKCYITAPGTLASGDTFNVVLPTAVNPSANAQFSVDGGTTYYPIKINTTQAIVANVAGKKVTLYYDGTNFNVINDLYLTGNVAWDSSVSNANGTLIKYGKVVYFAYSFTSPSSVTTDKVIATIPVGYRPIIIEFLPLVDLSNYTTSTAHMAIYDGDALVLVSESWISNKTYRGNAVWITKD